MACTRKNNDRNPRCGMGKVRVREVGGASAPLKYS